MYLILLSLPLVLADPMRHVLQGELLTPRHATDDCRRDIYSRTTRLSDVRH
jgi:hypothetical protein